MRWCFFNLGSINHSYFVTLELLLTVISQALLQALLLFWRFLLKHIYLDLPFITFVETFLEVIERVACFFFSYMFMLCILCD